MNNADETQLSKLQRSLSTVDRSARFACVPRDSILSEADCMDNFTDVHAFRRNDDPCWACRVGARLRVEYGHELEATEERVDAAVLLASRISPPAWAYRILRIINK